MSTQNEPKSWIMKDLNEFKSIIYGSNDDIITEISLIIVGLVLILLFILLIYIIINRMNSCKKSKIIKNSKPIHYKLVSMDVSSDANNSQSDTQ